MPATVENLTEILFVNLREPSILQPVELTKGTPFSAFFANSEVLMMGSPTLGPAMRAYFASALSNLSPDEQAELEQLDEKVLQVCGSYDPYPVVLYRPRMHTSPTDHAAVPDRDVYNIDRQTVAESDLLILAGIFPSLGAGMELQLALHSCSSVILLMKEDQAVSRMVTGCPARKRIVKYKNLGDLDERLVAALDALAPNLGDCRSGFNVASTTGIGERIRQFREHRRLTEKDLARLVGVGTRYVQDLEAIPEHIANPSLMVLRRIARVLNLSEGFLITGYDTPIQLYNPIFADHLRALDEYSSEVSMLASDYKTLWKDHVDRFAFELSIPGMDRRVKIGDRKYWMDKHAQLRRDNEKPLFSATIQA